MLPFFIVLTLMGALLVGGTVISLYIYTRSGRSSAHWRRMRRIYGVPASPVVSPVIEETSDVQGVMDGDLNEFIKSYLMEYGDSY